MTDPMGMYKQAVDRTGLLIAGVKPEQMSSSTPCRSFDVRALINHVIGGNYMFAAIQRGESVDDSAPTPDLAGDNPSAAYDQATRAATEMWGKPGVMEQTFTMPFGMSMPGSQVFGIALMETVVHGWDLAKATGQDTTIDSATASGLLEGMRGNIPDEFRGEEGKPFAPEIKVSENAPVQDKLLAYLGRRP